MINTRFRKKSFDVEAVRFHQAEYADNPLTFEAIPDWLQQAINVELIRAVFKGEDYWYLEIQTPEGTALAEPGEWVVRTSDGSLWRCPDKDFRLLYAPIEINAQAEEA